jgi:hypothetical protein
LRGLRSRRWIAVGQGLRGAGGQTLRRRGEQRVLRRLADRLAGGQKVLLVDEVEILVPDQVELLQDVNENGLARAVIFRKCLYDRLLLREQAALEIELRSNIVVAKVVLADLLQNEQV